MQLAYSTEFANGSVTDSVRRIKNGGILNSKLFSLRLGTTKILIKKFKKSFLLLPFILGCARIDIADFLRIWMASKLATNPMVRCKLAGFFFFQYCRQTRMFTCVYASLIETGGKIRQKNICGCPQEKVQNYRFYLQRCSQFL